MIEERKKKKKDGGNEKDMETGRKKSSDLLSEAKQLLRLMDALGS